jgi:hypothetical protein
VIVNDNTEVLECEPGRLLRLRARGWPLGEAEVAVTLAPSGAGTLVTIEETAVTGPGALIPGPFEDALITWRNRETLLRLAFIAENRRLP